MSGCRGPLHLVPSGIPQEARCCSQGSGCIPGPTANPLGAPTPTSTCSPHCKGSCQIKEHESHHLFHTLLNLTAELLADPVAALDQTARTGEAMVRPLKGCGGLEWLPFWSCLPRTPLSAQAGNTGGPEHLRVCLFIHLSLHFSIQRTCHSL